MSLQSNSYIKAMNDNMLQISRIFANTKRSYGEMLHDYKEAQCNIKEDMDNEEDDDIKFYRDLKKKIGEEMNRD